jgi:aryl-alcohol dehydrogenase-like predicted oxidoreductase
MPAEKSARDALNWFLRRKGVTAPIIGAWSIWKITSGPSAIEDVYPYRVLREMQQV